MICENETGQIDLIFFHARDDYVSRMLPAGERRIVSGRVELRQGRPQMAHPDHIVRPDAPEEMPQIEPVYPLTAGLSQRPCAGPSKAQCNAFRARVSGLRQLSWNRRTGPILPPQWTRFIIPKTQKTCCLPHRHARDWHMMNCWRTSWH